MRQVEVNQVQGPHAMVIEERPVVRLHREEWPPLPAGSRGGRRTLGRRTPSGRSYQGPSHRNLAALVGEAMRAQAQELVRPLWRQAVRALAEDRSRARDERAERAVRLWEVGSRVRSASYRRRGSWKVVRWVEVRL